MLAYLAGNEGPSCGYVGLCLPHVGPCWAKRSEKWEQQKNAVKRRIFWWSAAYLGAMLAHLGAMLAHLEAYVGPSRGLCWPMSTHLGAMLAHLEAYVGPSWGLCWPMLTHLEPQAPKNGKKGEEHKTLQNAGVFGGPHMSAAGAAAPLLRRGENCRTAMPRPGGLWPDRAAAPAADPGDVFPFWPSDVWGAVAFWGTDTLGAVAFRGISRSVSEIRVGKGGGQTQLRETSCLFTFAAAFSCLLARLTLLSAATRNWLSFSVAFARH